MASDLSSKDQEVEAKYRVGDLDQLIAALARQGVVLSEPSDQDDQAYAPVGWSYGMSKNGVPFARLRTERGRHLFTVKKPIDNEMACSEHESEVADRDAMHAALVTMGWSPTVRIRKQRRMGSWSGVSVCVDVVDQLGAFIEVERVVSAAESGERVQAVLDGPPLDLPGTRSETTPDPARHRRSSSYTCRREMPSSAAAVSAAACPTASPPASWPITSARRTASCHTSAGAVSTPCSATTPGPSITEPHRRAQEHGSDRR